MLVWCDSTLPGCASTDDNAVSCEGVGAQADSPVVRRLPRDAPRLTHPVTGLHGVLSSCLHCRVAGSYDPRDVPMSEKKACTVGMSMTEKQGGSDVRANTTTATPVVDGQTGPGAAYKINGHKWFTSAPMCDAFLTLAQTPKVRFRKGVRSVLRQCPTTCWHSFTLTLPRWSMVDGRWSLFIGR